MVVQLLPICLTGKIMVVDYLGAFERCDLAIQRINPAIT